MAYEKLYRFFGNFIYESKNKETEDILIKNSCFLGKNVLDLCSGHGTHIPAILSIGADVTAIDSNNDFINILKKKYSGNPKVKIFKQDIKKNIFGKRYSSILFLGNSISHFNKSDMANILEKIMRILDVNGKFVVEFAYKIKMPEVGELIQAPFWKEKILNISKEEEKITRELIKGNRKIISDYYVWTPEKLDALCKELDFKKEKSYKYGDNNLHIYGKKQI